MYLKRKAISLAEAQMHLSEIPMTPRQLVKKSQEAHAFILAEDIFATFPVPAFRRSGYDGFGILAEDDEDFPRDFEVVENIGAGSNFTGKLKSGQIVRIMTGAKVPDQVAKVIMLEQTETIDETHVRILESAKKSNITEIGKEIQQDEKVLPAGVKLNAGAISLLHAFGISEVQVYDKPKVAIVATGSELSGQPSEGKIYNSNGPLLASLSQEMGAVVLRQEVIADNLEVTRELIHELTRECDLVITTGGVSVGDFDYMAVIAQENNCLFNKLAMRPGSPTTAFVMNGKPVIALSGNPSACYTGFYFFAEPLIQRFQTLETAIVPYQAILPKGYNKKNEYDRYLHGFMNEESEVTLDGSGDSSELSSLWQANCFFKIPAGTVIPDEGLVDVWLIP